MASKIQLLATLCFLYSISDSIRGNVSKRTTTKCYGELGCFSDGAPFWDLTHRLISVTPEGPDKVLTTFMLYTKESPNSAVLLDARHTDTVGTKWPLFKKRPTKIIIHGFVDDPAKELWMKTMKTEFLKHHDFNIIIVDWHHGNQMPYTQATANTRLVGAQVALLIKQLKEKKGVAASSFHIIGHSLGAHTAGYAGEKTPGLARITGLDPAGPYFDGTQTAVRLDPTDATFVDAIHTDGKLLGLGIRQPVGHMDFFANMGHDQNGCRAHTGIDLINLGVGDTVDSFVSCSHKRSYAYFTESINTVCPFVAFQCNSESDFKSGKCNTCSGGKCSPMGYKATKNPHATNSHQIKYYTTTAAAAPFCEYHMDVAVTVARSSATQHEKGNFFLKVAGENMTTPFIQLNEKETTYNPGSTYHFIVGVHLDVGRVKSVQFKWHHTAWDNLFGSRTPKLAFSEIDVQRDEAGVKIRFCARNTVLESDKETTMSNTC